MNSPTITETFLKVCLIHTIASRASSIQLWGLRNQRIARVIKRLIEMSRQFMEAFVSYQVWNEHNDSWNSHCWAKPFSDEIRSITQFPFIGLTELSRPTFLASWLMRRPAQECPVHAWETSRSAESYSINSQDFEAVTGWAFPLCPIGWVLSLISEFDRWPICTMYWGSKWRTTFPTTKRMRTVLLGKWFRYSEIIFE